MSRYQIHGSRAHGFDRRWLGRRYLQLTRSLYNLPPYWCALHECMHLWNRGKSLYSIIPINFVPYYGGIKDANRIRTWAGAASHNGTVGRHLISFFHTHFLHEPSDVNICYNNRSFFPFDDSGIDFFGTTLVIKEMQNHASGIDGGGSGLNVWDGSLLLWVWWFHTTPRSLTIQWNHCLNIFLSRARYLERRPELVRNKSVLELGSGCE